MKLEILNPAQHHIMQILWQQDSLSITAILEAIPGEVLNYQQAYAQLQHLIKQGLVGAQKSAKPHTYKALLNREAYHKRMAEKIFMSYPQEFKSRDLDWSDLEKMMQLLKNRKKAI